MAYTTINKPSDYFNTKLYTGDSATSTAGTLAITISGVGFQPDFVWVKGRTTGGYDSHGLHDVVRTAPKWLHSDGTSAETDVTTGFSAGGIGSFTSDGFGIYSGTAGATTNYNTSGTNYVTWNWLANNTSGSSNTDGSITSTVSANTTSGFSIVSYTGTGANATVGHGLGVTPKMMIIKNRSDGTQFWGVYHTSLSGADQYLVLDQTSSAQPGSAIFNSTHPTSSVFSVGTHGTTNKSGDNFIAYCFAEKKGFSKFGSYIGNGTSGVDGAGDGTFVYTGFKPSMIIIKPTSTTGNWQILDNKRPGFNESDNLAPNNNAAENTSNDFVDLVSNGFKLRSGTYSASGVTYIYMAFAEAPLVGTNNIPCTAR